jgi:hypothetical protein
VHNVYCLVLAQCVYVFSNQQTISLSPTNVLIHVPKNLIFKLSGYNLHNNDINIKSFKFWNNIIFIYPSSLKHNFMDLTYVINIDIPPTLHFVYLRHGLVYWLYTISHSKFVYNLLGRFIKVHFPSFILLWLDMNGSYFILLSMCNF